MIVAMPSNMHLKVTVKDSDLQQFFIIFLAQKFTLVCLGGQQGSIRIVLGLILSVLNNV